MRYFIMTILFLISLILQSTLFSHLTVAGAKPDLVLVFIIFYALLHGPEEGALMGLIGGLLEDLMFGQFIGLNAMAKLTVGYVFGVLERKIYKENLLIPMFGLFAGTFLNESVLYLLQMLLYMMGIAGETSVSYFAAVRSFIFPTAVYNSCLTPFIYGKFFRSSQKGLLKITDT